MQFGNWGQPSGTLGRYEPGGPRRATTRNPALDGLRGIAILLVCLDHALGLRYAVLTSGLDIFFVLSGYLITTVALNEYERTGTVGLRAFFGRRARRILPALLAFAAVVVLLGLFGRLPTPSIYWEVLFGVALIYPAVFVAVEHGCLRRLSHLQSLFQEEWFYIFWVPVLTYLTVRRRLRAAIGVAAAIAGLGALQRLGLMLTGSSAVEAALRPDILFVGALLAFGRRHVAGLDPGPAKDRLRRLAVVAVWAGMAAFLVSLAVGLAARAPGFESFVERFIDDPDRAERVVHRLAYLAVGMVRLTAPALIAAVFVLPSTSWIVRVFTVSPLRWYGKISYGLYLWHPIVLFVVHPDVEIDRKRVWVTFPGGVWLPLIEVFVVSAAIAWASHRWIEQPFMRSSTASTTTTAPPTTPLP